MYFNEDVPTILLKISVDMCQFIVIAMTSSTVSFLAHKFPPMYKSSLPSYDIIFNNNLLY